MLIQEFYDLDINIMFNMISVNGTMYISVSHLSAYILYWNLYGFKIFCICYVFKPWSCSTKMYWIHPFSYCFFLSVTVKRIFLSCRVFINYFTFVQKRILLSSWNYNFKFLSTLEIYLHNLINFWAIHKKYVSSKICTYLVPLL